MNKYKVNINNLDCPNCAIRLEQSLNKSKKINNVIVNFNTSKITYESERELALNELNKLIKKVEPDAFASKEEIEKQKEYYLSILIIATIIGIIGIYIKLPFHLNGILIILSYILLLYRIFINAIKNIIKNKTINETSLITISCIGALLIGKPMEGMMVVILYTIGKILENKAVNNSRRSISDLINIKQNYANKKDGKSLVKVNVDTLQKGDLLVIKKGERIPVDSIIIKGDTSLDTSSLTGESDPLSVSIGDEVLSGSINIGDVIDVKVLRTFEDSTVAKILELVDEATDKKNKLETFVAKASRVYTPIILILAILVFIFLPLILNITYLESLYRGLTFLVISCPCAIAISVPLSYFTGIGVSSKNGILIKGSNYLDSLSHVNKIIFDKTGTLTNGSFTVTDIDILDKKYTKKQVIDILLKGESLSNHPIAKSIMKLSHKKIDNADVTNYKEISGKGISYQLNGQKIKVGNKLSCGCDIDVPLHLNIDGKHIASINIDDGIKDNVYEMIQSLKQNNIKTYMFTGDKKQVALEIGKKLNIDEIEAEMLPTDKYASYEKIEKEGDVIAFVGDGVNDAPTLKRATIGISMGGIGSEGAIESSDIVLMNDDISKIPLAISISKYTNYIVKQNLLFAISIKVLILILSIFGKTSMWMAVFADTGVTLLAILNTLRIFYKFKTSHK